MDEIAVDLLPLDELEQPVEGGAHVAIDGDGALDPVAIDERAEAVLERAADITGVARAGALAGLAGFEDGDAAAGARQRQGGDETGVAGADDGDVDRLRQRARRQGRAWRRIPPIGLQLEIRRQQRGVDRHRPRYPPMDMPPFTRMTWPVM